MIYASDADRIAAQLKANIDHQKTAMIGGKAVLSKPPKQAAPGDSMAAFLKAVQSTRPAVAPTLPPSRQHPVPPITRARARREHEAEGERSALQTAPPSSGQSSYSSGDYRLEPKPHAVRSRHTGLYQPATQGEVMERLTFRLPVALGADLRRLARRYRITSSEAVRVILADGVRHELDGE